MTRDEAVKMAYRHLWPNHMPERISDSATTRRAADALLDVEKRIARRCAEIAEKRGSDLADVRDYAAGGAFDAANDIRREFGLTEAE